MEHIVKTQTGYDLFSPKGGVCLSLTEEGGRLFYALKQEGRAKFPKSALGITIGKDEAAGTNYSTGNRLGEVAKEEITGREFTVFGRQEKRVENSVRYTVEVANAACAYAFEENGTTFCAIERAYREGKCSFLKPISCHLYPIRVGEYGPYRALNYDRWDVCKVAVLKGQKENLPLYKFLKEPLIRRFGEDWYAELELVAEELANQGMI